MKKEKIKVVVIRSAFNSEIVDNLYKGIEKSFNDKKLSHVMEVIEVPGAFEIPYMANLVLHRQRSNFADIPELKDNHPVLPDCIITLGCVIKGETAHFEYISNSCASTLSQLTLKSAGTPIMFGVITAYTREQALKRSEVNFGSQENINIGYNVANAAIEILSSKEKHRL